MVTMRENEFSRGFEEIEKLIADLDDLGPEAREKAVELVRLVLEFHAAGLKRFIELVKRASRDGEAILRDFAADEVVAPMLLLHDLHPQEVESRVRSALDQVRPYLQSHGGDAELLGIRDGVVTLHFNGSCDGCPSSAVTMKLAIEKAIYEAAPEITQIINAQDPPINVHTTAP
jgi:Fe-S cluster biogenesis protein NfuA